jgi:hypothetical protein
MAKHKQMPPGKASGSARSEQSDFAKEADKRSTGLLAEFWAYLRENKKWWLAPVIIVLLILSVLIILASSAAAPFIYTLF